MLGAIAGDVIGSPYEFHNHKSLDFPLFGKRSRFTDDSVLTVAVAEALLDGDGYGKRIRDWGRRYPDAGFGGMFRRWLAADRPAPYNSYGNGSAMRVSAVGWAFDDMDTVLAEAEKSAAPTHDHPEGIKGAKAVAGAIWLACRGEPKARIGQWVSATFGYDLARTVAGIRPAYEFDETCQGSVGEAIIAFLESRDWEDAVRLAVSLGGDSDTIACITGAIAQAFYGEMPKLVIDETRARLDPAMQAVLDRFEARYPAAKPRAI